MVLEAKRLTPLNTSLPPKRAIFIGATFRDLINLRGVLIIHSCFCFTLRTMFISSLEGAFKKSLRKKKKKSKIQLLYLLICFS